MKRIDTASKAVDKFGAGKHGYRDGNKVLGIAATDLNASSMDALQEEIANVIEAVMALDAGDNTQLRQAIQAMIAGSACILRFSTGAALPTTNIGAIWHDDYNSIMTWQVFSANGANYTGYASVLVGNLLMDTQPTPRCVGGRCTTALW
jgi:hypothetical protein